MADKSFKIANIPDWHTVTTLNPVGRKKLQEYADKVGGQGGQIYVPISPGTTSVAIHRNGGLVKGIPGNYSKPGKYTKRR